MLKWGMAIKHEIYISVDIEASGPIPREFSMLSVGACVVGKTSQRFYSELKPINENYIKKALEINGLSLEKLKITGELPAQAMGRFEAWIRKVSGESRPVFVAFNATFDWSFTHWYFIKFLGRDPFGISGLDIKSYFMGAQKSSWGETAKRNVRNHYPTKAPHTHKAVDDAIEQAEIFDKLLRRHS